MNAKICSVTECGRPHMAKGLCKPHWARQRKGIPLEREFKVFNAPPEFYFWKKVRKTESCWVWTAAVSDTGYGSFSVRRKRTSAHRFSYELANGPIPDGGVIDHLCHNRTCVNPAHLSLATATENRQNLSKLFPSNRSGINGVYWCQRTRKWAAQISVNGRKKFLGRYSTVAEAAVARRDAETEYWPYLVQARAEREKLV